MAKLRNAVQTTLATGLGILTQPNLVQAGTYGSTITSAEIAKNFSLEQLKTQFEGSFHRTDSGCPREYWAMQIHLVGGKRNDITAIKNPDGTCVAGSPKYLADLRAEKTQSQQTNQVNLERINEEAWEMLKETGYEKQYEQSLRQGLAVMYAYNDIFQMLCNLTKLTPNSSNCKIPNNQEFLVLYPTIDNKSGFVTKISTIRSADVKPDSVMAKEINVGASLTHIFYVYDSSNSYKNIDPIVNRGTITTNHRRNIADGVVKKLLAIYPQISSDQIRQMLKQQIDARQQQIQKQLRNTDPYQAVAPYRDAILAETGKAKQGSQALSEDQLTYLRGAELNFKNFLIGTGEFGTSVGSDLVIDAVSTATGPFAPAFSISLGTTTGYSISQLAEQLRIESERQSGKQISQEEESLRMGQVGTIGAVASAAPFAIGYGGKLFVATPQGNKIILKETTEQVGKNVEKKFSESIFEKLTEPQKFEYIKNLAIQNGFEMSSHSVKRLLQRDISFYQVLNIVKNGQLYKDLKNPQNYILYKDGKYITLYKDGSGGISTIVNANKTFPADRFAPVSRDSYYK